MPLESRVKLVFRCALLAVLAALVACAVPPATTPTNTAPQPAVVEPVPAPVTPPLPVAPVSEPPTPAAALSPQEVQRSLTAAIEFLQSGQEESAEVELNKVLQAEGNNRLAQSLLRQIKEDPVAALGRESFAYRVQPGESLSRIAQRHLNDLHLFYILARYNNIKVPRNLAGGQLIRLPGKGPVAPVPSPGAPATAAPSTPAANTTTPAGPGVVPPPTAPPAANPTAPTPAATEAANAARAAKARSEAIARHSRAARTAFAKQDLDGAIRAWDAVLELEPENRTAQLEKQKVLGLKERLGKVK